MTTKIKKIEQMELPSGKIIDFIQLTTGNIITIDDDNIEIYEDYEDWNEGSTLCCASCPLPKTEGEKK